MTRKKDSVESKNPERIEDPDAGDRIPPGGDALDHAWDWDDDHRGEEYDGPLVVRPPRQEDAADVWRLAKSCGELDPSSPYAYLLMCTDFAQTCLVARTRSRLGGDPEAAPGGLETDAADETAEAAGSRDGADERAEGELVAFVLGYRRPASMETLFVWQIGVAEDHRVQGMAARLLDVLVDRCRARTAVEYLETTVTPSDQPSRILFTHFARDRSARLHECVAFWSASFPEQAGEEKPHEDEIRLRIGPIRRDAA